MKISLSLLLFFFLTIACKRDNNQELEVLKEATFYLDNNNLKLFKRMEKEVADNGNKQKEVTFLNSLKALLSKRINTKSSSANLISYKSNIYTFVNDTLKATPKIEFKLKDNSDKNDSSSFFIYYQDILLFEKNLLELAFNNLSGCNWGLHFCDVYKTQDTISINEEYSIIVKPDLNFPRSIQITHNEISISKEGKKTLFPFKTEIVGGVLLLRFRPDKRGKYDINGRILAEGFYNELYKEHYFKDSFFVK